MTLKYKHLIGKPWSSGKDDCYGIGRDFYRDNFNIILTDYARPDDWWLAGLNLYQKYYKQEGFQIVDIPVYEARPADILLVAIKSSTPNHAGIFLGDGKILHHYTDRLSEEASLKGVWRNNLCMILRHKDVALTEEKQTIDIMDHILPSKRKALEDARAAQTPR